MALHSEITWTLLDIVIFSWQSRICRALILEIFMEIDIEMPSISRMFCLMGSSFSHLFFFLFP
jgi:hypothetical protein